MNHSSLRDKDIGLALEITGRLEFSDGLSFTLRENPESRSAVSFELVDADSFTPALRKKTGQIVTVAGTLVGVSSPWKKQLSVRQITE